MLKKLAAAALLTGLSVLMPMLLPSVPWAWEIEVALAGMLLPMNWAVGCAVAIPVSSAIAWGVPYLTTDLPLLVCQMIALAAFVNFFYGMVGWNMYGALAAAMALSLVMLFCAASVFGAVGGPVRALAYVRQTVTAGWPRMLLELAIVPPAVWLVRRMQERGRAA